MGGLATSWNNIDAGDIISFQYKGKKSSKKRLHTILVLNPRYEGKVDGKRTHHVIGLKLAEQRIRTIKEASKVVKQLLAGVGQLQVVDDERDIYRVEIATKDQFWKGAKYIVYKRVRYLLRKEPIYRTYDWYEAKNSAVQLAPLPLPPHIKKQIKEQLLVETKGAQEAESE